MNWIQFTHVLADDYGYAYKYIKRFEIPFDRNELKISHTLYNTGKKMIRGTHYTHNFTTIDNAKITENYEVELAFNGKFSRDIDEYATISGNKITFPGAPDKSFGSTIEGYTGDITENHVKIVNRRLGVGLDIKGDYPIREFMFYVDTLSISPEMYTYFDIPVGALYSWNTTYTPYEQ